MSGARHAIIDPTHRSQLSPAPWQSPTEDSSNAIARSARSAAGSRKNREGVLDSMR